MPATTDVKRMNNAALPKLLISVKYCNLGGRFR